MLVIHSLIGKKSPRQWGCLCLGAFIYALLFSLGSQIEKFGFTSFYVSLMRFGLSFPIALTILIFLFHTMDHLRFSQENNTCLPAHPIRSTLLSFLLIFLSYTPMFLIQFPGSYTYDIMPQAFQAASGNFNTFHPLLHTLFLKACLSCTNLFDSFERAAALCIVIQMALVSWCFAMVLSSIRRCFSHKVYLVVLAFFCIYPSHMAFATTYTKDTLFSASFSLFMALAFENSLRGSLSRLHRVIYVISGVLTCLFRNNMVYALAAWFVFLLLSQKSMRRMTLYALLILFLAKGISDGLVVLTNAESGPLREMLSVPAQQFARVRLYAGDQLTQQQCERMDALFDQVIYERYDPTIADPIKDRISEQALAAHPAEALNLYLTLGKKYPGLYLDAFLHTALPALYPYSHYNVSPKYIEVGVCSIGLTTPYGLEQIQQPRRFAAIRQLINTQIYDTGADHLPLVRYLFNSGFIFWLLLLQLLYDLYIGDMRRISVMFLPLMLWGTYLLGPVMQGRYLYPFVCILPSFLLRYKAKQ